MYVCIIGEKCINFANVVCASSKRKQRDANTPHTYLFTYIFLIHIITYIHLSP
jgi:hypothetical protein